MWEMSFLTLQCHYLLPAKLWVCTCIHHRKHWESDYPFGGTRITNKQSQYYWKLTPVTYEPQFNHRSHSTWQRQAAITLILQRQRKEESRSLMISPGTDIAKVAKAAILSNLFLNSKLCASAEITPSFQLFHPILPWFTLFFQKKAPYLHFTNCWNISTSAGSEKTKL